MICRQLCGQEHCGKADRGIHGLGDVGRFVSFSNFADVLDRWKFWKPETVRSF